MQSRISVEPRKRFAEKFLALDTVPCLPVLCIASLDLLLQKSDVIHQPIICTYRIVSAGFDQGIVGIV